MGVTLQLLSGLTGVKLEMGGPQKARREQVLPIFERVSRASADHPSGRGPMDPQLLDAIAWTESRHAWDRSKHGEHLTVGVKLRDVPGTGLEGEERALGLMQVWSGHDGERFGKGWWPEPGGDGMVWTVESWEDPVTSVVAATEILFQGGYGVAAREMLRAYSGARPSNTEAINDYVNKVTTRHLYLSSAELLNAL